MRLPKLALAVHVFRDGYTAASTTYRCPWIKIGWNWSQKRGKSKTPRWSFQDLALDLLGFVFTGYWALLKEHSIYIITVWWFGSFFIFPYIGNVIIPTDKLTPSFFRGVGQPPTSINIYIRASSRFGIPRLDVSDISDTKAPFDDFWANSFVQRYLQVRVSPRNEWMHIHKSIMILVQQ